MLLEQFVFVGVSGQLGGDGEQLPLEFPEQVVHPLVAGEGPGHAHGGDGLVGYAIGLGVGAVLGDPAAVEQAGFAGVAEFGIDPFPVVAGGITGVISRGRRHAQHLQNYWLESGKKEGQQP